MYITGIYSSTPVYKTPTNRLNNDTLFKYLDPTDYPFYNSITPLQKPVDVVVNKKIEPLTDQTSIVEKNIATAVNRSSTIQTYVKKVKSLVEEVKSLADISVESTYTNEYRGEINTRVQEILTELDGIFGRAEFNNEAVMQGGTVAVGVSLEGTVMDLNYGNADRVELGLTSVDISSISNAQTAQTTVDSALGKIGEQLTLATQEGESLQKYYDQLRVEPEYISSNLSSSEQEVYDLSAHENAKAVIAEKFDYVLALQGNDIRTSIVSNMLSGLEAIGSVVTKLYETDKTGDEPKKAQENDKTSEGGMKYEKKPVEEAEGNSIINVISELNQNSIPDIEEETS